MKMDLKMSYPNTRATRAKWPIPSRQLVPGWGRGGPEAGGGSSRSRRSSGCSRCPGEPTQQRRGQSRVGWSSGWRAWACRNLGSGGRRWTSGRPGWSRRSEARRRCRGRGRRLVGPCWWERWWGAGWHWCIGRPGSCGRRFLTWWVAGRGPRWRQGRGRWPGSRLGSLRCPGVRWCPRSWRGRASPVGGAWRPCCG